MKDFFRILKYTKSYYIYIILNIVFNILTVLFSLVSLTMVIPFLGLLFGTIQVENIKPEGFYLTPESLKDHLYYEINLIIQSGEKEDIILYLCPYSYNIFPKKSISIPFIIFSNTYTKWGCT